MIVLDTNVLSELLRPVPDEHAVAWLRAQPARELGTTVVNEAELLRGLRFMPDGKRRRALEARSIAIFEELGARVLPFDRDAARTFARICADRRARGRPINDADAQIAAISCNARARLATRDLDDFADCGVDVVNPWGD